MILHFYIARKFLFNFFGVFFLFGGVLYLVEIVENLRRHSVGEAGVTSVFRLTLLAIPTSLYQIIPLITVIATISLFISLSRSSELVVARAAGRSALRSLIAPIVVAAVLGALLVSIFNPIVAATSREYESSLSLIEHGNTSALSVSSEGLWLRQGDSTGQTVIRAVRADLDGTSLRGVTFLGLGKDGKPTFRVEAQRADLFPGEWRLQNAKIWRLDGPANPERFAKEFETYEIQSDLTRDQIRDSFGTPRAISFWDLPGFIARLDAAGFSALSHRVWFQAQLALPLTMVAMVMIAAGFTLRHTRMGRTGAMILLATAFGFALHFVRYFAVILAENGQIPSLLGAWGPAAAAILLSLALLLHLEDG